MLSWVVGSQAQDDSQVAEGAQLKTHTNSLGQQFHAIPGIPVLMGVYEARVSEYEKFRLAKELTAHKPHFEQGPDHPAVNVSLQEAQEFCAWLTAEERKSGKLNELQSYRLPSTKEWEAAVGIMSARHTNITTAQDVDDKRTFPWGLEWPPPAKAGNYNSEEIDGSDDGYRYTAPVGQFSKSAEGIYDLAGNVWEWTWDVDVQGDGKAALRGGSWMYFRKECLLSSYRYVVPVSLRAPSVGFRYVFEDKHQSALYLAAVQKATEAEENKRREMMSVGPEVSAEEVARMKESLARKTDSAGGGSASNLPELSTLTPAKAGQPFTNSLGMKFVTLEGNVLVGEHETRIQDFRVWKTELGQAWQITASFELQENYPVINVTWQEAKDFCAWLTERDRKNGLIGPQASYRLPTDIQWSLAVGLTEEAGSNPKEKNGANKDDFPWGREVVPPILAANLDTARMSGYQDRYPYLSPVGSFSPNKLGIYDLAGNVAEWCEDTWPDAAEERVVRGSSWLTSESAAMLSSTRQHFPAATTSRTVGFRAVLDLGTP